MSAEGKEGHSALLDHPSGTLLRRPWAQTSPATPRLLEHPQRQSQARKARRAAVAGLDTQRHLTGEGGPCPFRPEHARPRSHP